MVKAVLVCGRDSQRASGTGEEWGERRVVAHGVGSCGGRGPSLEVRWRLYFNHSGATRAGSKQGCVYKVCSASCRMHSKILMMKAGQTQWPGKNPGGKQQRLGQVWRQKEDELWKAGCWTGNKGQRNERCKGYILGSQVFMPPPSS